MGLGNRVVSQNLIELGRRIRNRRLDLHFSQEGIAEKLGMSVNTGIVTPVRGMNFVSPPMVKNTWKI